MKKRNLKNKVAVLLSASMTLAMLAPAMPAHAADNTKLVFNFTEKNEAIKNIVTNLEYPGESGHYFKDRLPSGWSVQPAAPFLVGLPYWNSAELNGGNDGFNASVNAPQDWETGMDLKGYEIKEWRNDNANATKVDRVEQPYFQNRPATTYYATIGDNGADVASYWVTRRGKAGVYVPGVKDDDAKPFKAGASI